ncbi:NmrA family NAD(P)-binding protein [Plantactinospora sp. WMMB334]|uniref:NmrA family NAD(P)-binding protein n=1 Tax=Plantactinospora sp. WMMB334 TaxID=3404119 RepID=UPI003B966647
MLAVGAAGKFAGLVVPALAERGANVRGLVRHGEQAADVRRRGAAEVVVGDLTDRDSMKAALAGVERVFYVAPAFVEDEAELGRAFVADAVAAGVHRIVFSSVVHPVLSRLVNHSAKAPVEEVILDAGLEFTFLHPVLFFQMYAYRWKSMMDSGVLAEPWSAETRFSRVDYRDVADVAARALTGDELLSGTFDLAAPGELSRHDIAALVTEVTGRPVRAQHADPGNRVPPPMRAMFEHYDHVGLVANPLPLRAILGREPRSLRAYFEELAEKGDAS